MSLPFRNRGNLIRFCSGVLCAIVIALAMPSTASAWHGDWRPRHYRWHHGGWGQPFFVPPPFGMRVYPGYYPAPVYSAPYYPGPSAFVAVPPVSLSFGFNFRR